MAAVVKKIKSKSKKVKAVQQKKKLFRASDPILSVFMWGVNYSITSLTHVEEPALLLEEYFKAYSKVRVDNHLFNKENMVSHFKMKEYCPLVFRNLRERFDVYEDDFLNSLTRSQPLADIDSPGKSGAKFYLSQDHLYLIKTMSSDDIAEMHGILAKYHEYIVEKHAKTMLPQYLAIYRLTVEDSETYLVVMRNAFSPLKKIHRKYDVKGSTVDRAASDKEKAKDLPTLKDMDLISDDVKIHLGVECKSEFMQTLRSDVNWLSEMNLMDYSLLIGIHDCERAIQELAEEQLVEQENGYDDEYSDGGELSSSPGNPARGGEGAGEAPRNPVQDDSSLGCFAYSSTDENKQEIYYLCLIDILTHYGMKKKTANAAKQVKHGREAEISTVKPDQYAKRFLDFVNRIIV